MRDLSVSTIPTDRNRIHAARRFTRRLATSHYENFTVVSLALPRSLRQDFYNIYAFCRHADDLADEISDSAESLAALDTLRRDLMALYEPRNGHPAPPQTARSTQAAILLALSDTIARHQIPPDPFLKLIDAFEQDRRVNRYNTYEQVLHYCTRSADPVGHLVLYLCGYRDAHRQRLSDYTCTALQLTNFWQDISRDYVERNRIYLPREDMERFGVSEADIAERRFTPAVRELIRFEVDRAEALFDQGAALLPLLHPRYRTDIELFNLGGRAILKAIRDQDYDTLTSRPTLGKAGKLGLFARVLARRLL